MPDPSIPEELSFLEEVISDHPSIAAHFSLLESNYNDSEWIISGLRQPINFDIELFDGIRLLDTRKYNLLTEIKAFLALQSHPLVTGGLNFSPDQERKRLKICLGIIDWMLLNSETIPFYKHGFKVLSEGVINALIDRTQSTRDAADRFYDWSNTLRGHLLTHIRASYYPHQIHPLILATPDEHLFTLGMSHTEVMQSRIFLYSNLSRITTKAASEQVFRPLIFDIYKNTLGGREKKPIPPELQILDRPSGSTEFERAAVRSTHDRMVLQNFKQNLSCIESISLLSEFGIEIPKFNIQEITAKKIYSHSESPDRYVSLPIDEVFRSLKLAVEFALTHGKHILDSCLSVQRAAIEEGLSPAKYSNRHGISQLLHPDTKELGVSHWSYNSLSMGQRSATPYHTFLRSNLGLLELSHIFYGAALVIMSTTSARRQDELRVLHPAASIDRSQSLLLFYVGKSGFSGARTLAERPIPPLFTLIVDLIESFQQELINIGAIDNYRTIFSIPGQNTIGLRCGNFTHMNQCLDLFCDYIQTGLNDLGERRYIRTHQLRRFFVQVFYWTPSFRSLDTISWYLGHTDPAYLYYYITNEYPGSVLRNVQAEYACDRVMRGIETQPELERLIAERYKTTKFSILDKEELTDYLEYLISTKTITVEPDFSLATPSCKYSIVIKVTYG